MKTVIEMAREAGWDDHHAEFDTRLKRFADLVRADEQKKWQDQAMVDIHEAVLDEREACAKVIDEMAEDMVREMEPSTAIAYVRSKAAAIRAIGEMK